MSKHKSGWCIHLLDLVPWIRLNNFTQQYLIYRWIYPMFAVNVLWLTCSLKVLIYLVFQPLDFERTWWRLFWTYLMKVILNVPDERYSERTWWRLFWTYLMKVILNVPNEGYSERTWWRLFWTYLMKVILSVPDEGYSRNSSWALNFISTFLLPGASSNVIWQ